MASRGLAIAAERGVEFAREFIADMKDLGDWAQIEPFFERLAEGIEQVQTPEALERWLGQLSELEAALDEEYSRRYIAMTCRTDDLDLERAYLEYLEQVVPRIKTWRQRLSERYLACPARQKVEPRRLEVLDRSVENQVKLFREENIALQTEESKLGQVYQKICGAMTIMWEGEEKTLQQMARYQEEPARTVRQRAWQAVADRRLRDRGAIDDLFERMVELRTRMAQNAGFSNFRDYKHRAYNRFDYTPEDCRRFHETIRQVVVPRLERQRRRRRERLGVEALRPWDLRVDPVGGEPLRPFKEAEALAEGCGRIFERIDPELGQQFDRMRKGGLLDLESRKGKAPGGYQCTLEEVRLPFIFMNAAGTQRDVMTLLHEGGHAFHTFASRREALLDYRSAPMEFSEVASMTMELFGLDHLDVFFEDAADRRRARRRHLEDVFTLFPWIAQVDAFQHEIYLSPAQTAHHWEDIWVGLDETFGPGVEWSGLTAQRRSAWHRQLHLFEVPFYYIEYGIAQLGALQMWRRFREEPKAAVDRYRRALELGGSRPLPELFEAAGIRFDFSPEILEPAIQAVAKELEAMD